jgi:hypothetical protein
LEEEGLPSITLCLMEVIVSVEEEEGELLIVDCTIS